MLVVTVSPAYSNVIWKQIKMETWGESCSRHTLQPTQSSHQHMCVRFLHSLAHTHTQTHTELHTPAQTTNMLTADVCIYVYIYINVHTRHALSITPNPFRLNTRTQRKEHFLLLHIHASSSKPGQRKSNLLQQLWHWERDLNAFGSDSDAVCSELLWKQF